jgi:hypothetical protein
MLCFAELSQFLVPLRLGAINGSKKGVLDSDAIFIDIRGGKVDLCKMILNSCLHLVLTSFVKHRFSWMMYNNPTS